MSIHIFRNSRLNLSLLQPSSVESLSTVVNYSKDSLGETRLSGALGGPLFLTAKRRLGDMLLLSSGGLAWTNTMNSNVESRDVYHIAFDAI